MSFEGGPDQLRAERDLLYEPVSVGGALLETDLSASWNLRDADAPRWRTTFSEDIPTGLAASLPGVLWTHTPGPPSGGDATAWARDLASHFWSGRGRMRSQPRTPTGTPFPCIDAITPWIARGVYGPSPIPWFGFRLTDCGISLPSPEIAIRVGPDVFELQPGLDPPWAEWLANPDLRWVAASESGAWLPADGLRYVGLSANDLALAAVLDEVEDDMIDRIAERSCGLDECGPPTFTQATRTLVLSAGRRTLWAIDDEAIGADRRRIHAMDVDSRQWRDLEPEGVVLGRVLAATYSHAHDALWILDEVGDETLGYDARLLRVEVHAGSEQASIQATWPRCDTSATQDFVLAADPAGTLYLAFNYADEARSHIVRIEMGAEGAQVTGGAVVDVEQLSSAALAMLSASGDALRASEHGLTILLNDAAEGAFPVALPFTLLDQLD